MRATAPSKKSKASQIVCSLKNSQLKSSHLSLGVLSKLQRHSNTRVYRLSIPVDWDDVRSINWMESVRVLSAPNISSWSLSNQPIVLSFKSIKRFSKRRIQFSKWNTNYSEMRPLPKPSKSKISRLPHLAQLVFSRVEKEWCLDLLRLANYSSAFLKSVLRIQPL